MVIRTYFDKNNTIVKNQSVNTGLNPVTELFYGGADGKEKFSRFLLHFDETRIKSLYTGGTYTDITKLKHTLRMTNTASFDTALLNGTMGSKARASSFDLIRKYEIICGFSIFHLFVWKNGSRRDSNRGSPDLRLTT